MKKILSFLLCTVVATTTFAATKASSVTQHHITWTFDKEYQIGQFVNGDWWVVGPVNIVSITNDLNDKSYLPTDDETVVNGSMINPVSDSTDKFTVTRNGFDSRLRHYENELNAALPGGKPLSADNPLTLKPDQSLVSVVSWLWRSNEDKEEGCPRVPEGPPNEHVRPTLRAAAVLTALAKPPPESSFRPAYSGDKKRMFNVNQLRLDRLGKLDPVEEITASPAPSGHYAGRFASPHSLDTPALGEYPAFDYWAITRGASIPQLTYATSHLWLSYISNFYGDEAFHPALNMPNYGREICWILSTAMLALNTDWEKIEGKPDKMPLLINLVQIGIDYAGAADAGSYWIAGGGHHGGRKHAILFAGLLLDDKHMMNVGHWKTPFQDNDQYIHITEADVEADKALPPFNFAILHNSHYIPATAEAVGLPEWIFWSRDGNHGANVAWKNTGYRIICNSYTPTFALVFTIMEDGRKLFNHDAFFDYADRIMSRDQELMQNRNYETLSAFAASMWRKYRHEYPTTYDKKWDDDKFISSIMEPMIILNITGPGRWGYNPTEPVRINLGTTVADLSKITPEYVTVTDPRGDKVPVEKITPGDPNPDHILLHFAPDTLTKGDHIFKLDPKAFDSLRDDLGRPPVRDAVIFRVN